MSAASLPRTHSRLHPAVRSALGTLPSAPARPAPGRGPAPVIRMPRPAPPGAPAAAAPGAANPVVATPAVTTPALTTPAVTTIDCDSCPVRSWSACSGCVVAVLIGFPPGIEPVSEPVSRPVSEPVSEPVSIRRRCGDHTAAARPQPLLLL